MLSFLKHFVVATACILLIDNTMRRLTGENMISFILTHLLLVPLVLSPLWIKSPYVETHPQVATQAQKVLDTFAKGWQQPHPGECCATPGVMTFKNSVWWMITVSHGIAHIVHPAFIGTEPNPEYTSLYDYIVHSIQCLLVWYYHQDAFPVGVFGAIVMLVASAMTHMDKDYFETNFWLFASGFGVFGAIYHMMLINHTRDTKIFAMNFVIWSVPYVGYLYPGYIPIWDEFVNSIGVFRIWFAGYFVAQHMYNQRKLFLSDQTLQTSQEGRRIFTA